LKYPGSWPPRHPDVVMVDGGGGRPFWGGSFLELSHSQMFSTDALPNGHQVRTRPARGWVSMPNSSKPPLECRLEYRPESGRIPEFLQFEAEALRLGEPVELWALILASGNAGYDTAIICSDTDPARAWAALGPGEWSASLQHAFAVQGDLRRGTFRIILERLDPGTGDFALHFTQVYPIEGFTQPAGIGPELVDKLGAYFNHPGFSEMAMGWFRKPDTFLRLLEVQHEWFGKAGRYLMETREWDFFAMQSQCIDFANHIFVPRRGWSAHQRKENLGRLARCYEIVDRMVGELLAGAGENALVCVISDHGATESTAPEVFVDPILHQAGLLVYEDTSDEVRPRPDMSRTLAVQQRAAFIYVNCKGRDPGGIVPPGQYEAVRDRIIDALRSYREPTTNRNPFAMILRKEDARILGLYDSLGRDIGDVVYALLPEFDHEHGRQLPGATLGQQTMKPLLVFSGPGIRKGTVLSRTAWIIDAVPTISHVMGWPVPTETEGAVLYQLLASHKTVFPRRDFMEKQESHLRAVTSRLAESAESPARAALRPSASEAPQADKRAAEEAALPDDPEALRQALQEARAEAAKWKRAYEQYHRITHGN
ncbi:MAG: alkaline phosphatase family protein, partial [Pseudomonadota bacterium]